MNINDDDEFEGDGRAWGVMLMTVLAALFCIGAWFVWLLPA